MSIQDAPAPGFPPPGWYPDGGGAQRWWDGQAWTGAVVPNRPPDRTWAVLAHLGMFVLPVVGALVIRLTRGSVDSQDPFTRHHSTEALNAQILFAILSNGALLPVVIGTMANAANPSISLFLVGWVFGVGSLLTTMGLSIRGAVQAYRGVWWRYPIDIHFVRGTAAREG